MGNPELLAGIYREVADVELGCVKRAGNNVGLLAECKTLQKTRNEIIHKGATAEDAEGESARAQAIANAVFDDIVMPMVAALGLKVIDRGEIVRAQGAPSLSAQP